MTQNYILRTAPVILIILVFPVLIFCSGRKPDKYLTGDVSLIDTSKIELCERILTPDNFERVRPSEGSFAFYLQHLPLKPYNSEVFLFNGNKKGNQHVHAAVINIDVGNRDLQQCADAVMRLRAEYLFEQKKYDQIYFNFVSDGKPRYLKDYCSDKTDYTCYRKYLNYIFSYANTRSLFGQLIQKQDFNRINIGDVLIQTGNPYGHAIIVVDMAVNNKTGDKIFLLAQSYMPAQDIHVLKNMKNSDLSPWYAIPVNEIINTPEWTFYKNDLRSFE